MLKNYGKHELSFVLKFGRIFLPCVTFCPDGFGSLYSFVSLLAPLKLLRMGVKNNKLIYGDTE